MQRVRFMPAQEIYQLSSLNTHLIYWKYNVHKKHNKFWLHWMRICQVHKTFTFIFLMLLWTWSLIKVSKSGMKAESPVEIINYHPAKLQDLTWTVFKKMLNESFCHFGISFKYLLSIQAELTEALCMWSRHACKQLYSLSMTGWEFTEHTIWRQALVLVSPDVILCAWLGLKHQLTN